VAQIYASIILGPQLPPEIKLEIAKQVLKYQSVKILLESYKLGHAFAQAARRYLFQEVNLKSPAMAFLFFRSLQEPANCFMHPPAPYVQIIQLSFSCQSSVLKSAGYADLLSRLDAVLPSLIRMTSFTVKYSHYDKNALSRLARRADLFVNLETLRLKPVRSEYEDVSKYCPL
jgi:hypothetical protein